MKTTVVCLPGMERGGFGLGVIKTFRARGVKIDRMIVSSAGAFPAVAFAAGLTEEAIQEYLDFDLRAVVKLPSIWQRLFSLHKVPGIFKNTKLKEWIIQVLNRHNMLERLTTAPQCEINFFAADLLSGERVVLTPADRLVDALLATSALIPLWPPVILENRQLIDGVFAPTYFVDEVLSNPHERFIVCLGDPKDQYPPIVKPMRSWISACMRTADILCAAKANQELRLLESLGVTGTSRIVVLSSSKPLLRVSMFKKIRNDMMMNIEQGCKAAEDFLNQ